MTTLSKSAAKQKLGRHLRPLESRYEQWREFEIYSLTRCGHEHEHIVCIGLEDRSVHCTCEHFTFHFARQWPTIDQTDKHCKHISKAMAYLKRHKELPTPLLVRPCVSCAVTNAEHGLCDEEGHPLSGHICNDCVRRARMMDAVPAGSLTETTCTNEVDGDGDNDGGSERIEAIDPCPYCGREIEELEGETGLGLVSEYYCDTCGRIPAGAFCGEAA